MVTEGSGEERVGRGYYTPYPLTDPTKLTTDAVNAATAQWRRDLELIKEDIREIRDQLKDGLGDAKEQRHVELAALRDSITTRIDGIEQATTLRIAPVDRLPAEMQKLVDQLNDVLEQKIVSLRTQADEKFASIAKQFEERDVRTTQASGAADDALKAALQAAKELVGAQGEASAAAAVKSETSFTKQIDQIVTIIQTLENALGARITELKERIDRGEGNTSGRVEHGVETRANYNVLIGVTGVVLAVVTIAVTVLIVILGK